METKRKSLIDDMPEPVSTSKRSGGSSDKSSSDKIKGGIAILVLALVGIWLAYFFGLIGGGTGSGPETMGGAVMTPEVKQEAEHVQQQQLERQQKMIERGAEVGSSG